MRPSPCLVLSLASVAYSLPIISLESRQLLNIAPEIAPSIGFGGKNSCIGLGISVCDPITVNHDDKSSSSGEASDGNEVKGKDHEKPPTGKNNDENQVNGKHDGEPPIGKNHNQNQVKGDGGHLPPNQYHGSPSKGKDHVGNQGNGKDHGKPPSGKNHNEHQVKGDGKDSSPEQYHGSPPNAHPKQPEQQEEPSKEPQKESAQPTASSPSLVNLSPKINPHIDLVPENGCLGIGISACDPITVNGDDKSDGTAPSAPQPEGKKEQPALGLLGLL